jgi:hypothetical protein
MENVKQLTGKGVDSLEHCPPSVHFDLSTEEFHRMLDDPVETLASIGLEVPRGTPFTLLRWTEAFSEAEGWQARGSRETKGICCHVQGDGGVACWVHHQ